MCRSVPDATAGSGSARGAVIGIAAGACVLLLAVTALVIALLKKRRNGR